MRKALFIIFLLQISILSQTTTFDFYSPENIKLFADYLFCEGDYLRAIEQYELLDNKFVNDTVLFKLMLGYSDLKLYQKSNKIINKLNYESKFYNDAYLLSMKNEVLISQKPLDNTALSAFNISQQGSFDRLSMISILYGDEQLIKKSDFISMFNKKQQNTVSLLYDYKFDPPYKNPAWAGIFSAIIPGSGKMYVGEWGDGITGFLLTGLFAFLAYDNFNADHNTRAWIFTGIGAFFYAGNIYGSIAAAQIFNAKINFDFQNGLNLFLEQENYFLPEYDFCN
jgi:hypothetical protein